MMSIKNKLREIELKLNPKTNGFYLFKEEAGRTYSPGTYGDAGLEAEDNILETEVDEGLVNVKSKKNRIEYIGDFPNGVWTKHEYDENGNEIYTENSNGKWDKLKYDENGNVIYNEDSDGYWVNYEYDENNREIFRTSSSGYWSKTEYNENNEIIYYENSRGEITDRRSRVNESLVNVTRKQKYDLGDRVVFNDLNRDGSAHTWNGSEGYISKVLYPEDGIRLIYPGINYKVTLPKQMTTITVDAIRFKLLEKAPFKTWDLVKLNPENIQRKYSTVKDEIFEVVQVVIKFDTVSLLREDNIRYSIKPINPDITFFTTVSEDEIFKVDNPEEINESLVNVKSKKYPTKIVGDYPDGIWKKTEYDKNGNEIYTEKSNGYWARMEYNENGKCIYWENSDRAWGKWEYDENGKVIYYEDSDGEIVDRRNQVNESLVNVTRKLKLKDAEVGDYLKKIFNDNSNYYWSYGEKYKILNRIPIPQTEEELTEVECNRGTLKLEDTIPMGQCQIPFYKYWKVIKKNDTEGEINEVSPYEESDWLQTTRYLEEKKQIEQYVSTIKEQHDDFHWDGADLIIMNEGKIIQTLERSTLTEQNILTENHKNKYACLMTGFDIPLWQDIMNLIDPEDLYTEEEGYGMETDPHTTILFGLHNNEVETEKLKQELLNINEIPGNITGMSSFNGEETNRPYDVVKLDVESELLHGLNQKIKQYPHTNEFPEYHPHITIAYVKKGMGQKYHGELPSVPTVLGKKIIYSYPSGKKDIWELPITSDVMNSEDYLKEGLVNVTKKQKPRYPLVIITSIDTGNDAYQKPNAILDWLEYNVGDIDLNDIEVSYLDRNGNYEIATLDSFDGAYFKIGHENAFFLMDDMIHRVEVVKIVSVGYVDINGAYTEEPRKDTYGIIEMLNNYDDNVHILGILEDRTTPETIEIEDLEDPSILMDINDEYYTMLGEKTVPAFTISKENTNQTTLDEEGFMGANDVTGQMDVNRFQTTN